MPFYKFAPGIDPNSYIFPTDQGWLYSVSFPNRTNLFHGNNVLENGGLAFEIIFERSSLDKPTNVGDPFVPLTILTIISKQFEGQGILPIYFFLCDMTDKQEAARARLFNRWYESCELIGWDLVNFELQTPDKNDKYYAGLFVHTEHPNSNTIPDAFEQFLKQDISNGKLINRR